MGDVDRYRVAPTVDLATVAADDLSAFPDLDKGGDELVATAPET
jgi:hypothetical protein